MTHPPVSTAYLPTPASLTSRSLLRAFRCRLRSACSSATRPRSPASLTHSLTLITSSAMDKARETSVCVIGAGIGGIVTVKTCLENGFQVTCFDKAPYYGGLWNYQPGPDCWGQEHASVMRSTVLNTSKELSAFSDFPPPARLPNFMKHSLYMDYIKSYVQHFDLERHMRLGFEVISCKLVGPVHEPYWLVETVRVGKPQLAAGSESEPEPEPEQQANQPPATQVHKFDKLLVATGHHNIPHMPEPRPGQHKFKGLILHSVQLKDVANDPRLIGKSVVVVGLANSACDAACDISAVASKCYLSSHRGSWLNGRLTPSGLLDFELKTRWAEYWSSRLPGPLAEWSAMRRHRQRLNYKLLGLHCHQKPGQLRPVVNDMLAYKILTGFVNLRGSIREFTETGIVFDEPAEELQALDDKTAARSWSAVDVVVFATGYSAKFDFLDEQQLQYRSAENEHELYLNMFAPRIVWPQPAIASKSMAFIGLVQPTGSALVIGELQARLASLVFADKLSLPDAKAMLAYVRQKQRARAHVFMRHAKDQLVGTWMSYCDELATIIQCKPNLAALMIKDFALWRRLVFGPSVSYQYRLAGPHSWPGARDAIMAVPQRVNAGINEGRNSALYRARRRQRA